MRGKGMVKWKIKGGGACQGKGQKKGQGEIEGGNKKLVQESFSTLL